MTRPTHLDNPWIIQNSDVSANSENSCAEDGLLALHLQDTPPPAPMSKEHEEPLLGELPDRHRKALFDGGPCFAILDANKLPDLVLRLEADKLQFRSLFDHLDEDLSDVAPYLVQMQPDAGLTRALVRRGDGLNAFWDNEPGIFIHTDATFDDVHAHLSLRVKPNGPNGAPVFFRYWDPAIAFDYMARIADWPQRARDMLTLPDGQDLALTVFRAEPEAMRRITLSSDCPSTPYVAQLQLTKRDLMHLEQGQTPILIRELGAWLKRSDPVRFRPFDTARLERLVAHGVSEGRRLQLSFKEEFAYFLYMMTFLGGWFHRSPVYAELSRTLLSPRQDRYLQMRNGFPEQYGQMFAGAPTAAQVFHMIENHVNAKLQERKSWAAITQDDIWSFAARAETILCLRNTHRDTVRAEAMAACDGLGLIAMTDRGLFYCLWLLLGARFHEDPMFPWAHEKMYETSDAAENLHAVVAYALRRVQRLNAMDRRKNAKG